jgi:polyisoprenyl-phosphate glycosyltransferase
LPPRLSVVSPVFKAENCIDELHRRLTAVLRSMEIDYEIVLVDDGSPDRSGERIEQIAASDARVTALLRSRNFGQHPAILAGLAEARGEAIVVIDCDLQDAPEDIPKLYAKMAEGFDVVVARRVERKDSFFKRATSRLWFAALNRLSDFPADPGRGTFSIVTRAVADELLRMPNRRWHYQLILRWLGFRQTYVSVEHRPRFAGRSSYSLAKLVAHALAGVVSHSTRLLYFSVYAGFAFMAFSIVQFGYVIFLKLAHNVGVAGWASVMAAIWLVGGAILFSVGVIGAYLGGVVEDVQQRPIYVVRRRIRSESP